MNHDAGWRGGRLVGHGGADIGLVGQSVEADDTPRTRGGTMPEYTVVPDGIQGYGVEISSTESFRSVRGFLTKSAALAWILEQQVHDAAEVDKRVSE